MSYIEYFLNSSSEVIFLETLQISHSAFSQVYYIVRNAPRGLTADIEGSISKTFAYYPVKITPLSSLTNLDQAFSITFGDLGQVLPLEMKRVTESNKFYEKPKVVYRAYRSDNLSDVLYGPFNFEVNSFSFNKEGATFEASAPSLNLNRTGELYTLNRFPMLRGFL